MLSMRNGWLLCLTVLSVIAISLCCSARAADGSTWLSTSAPAIAKVVDYAPDTVPNQTNSDCSDEMVTILKGSLPQEECIFSSPVGAMTTSGLIQTGEEQWTSVQGQASHTFLLPSPTSAYGVVAESTPGLGSYLGVYRHLSKSQLKRNVFVGNEPFYSIQTAPDAMIVDPVTQRPLQFDTSSVAFSASGEWMVASMPHRGLVRVHMTDLSVQLFSAPLEPEWFLGAGDVSLTISDDGRYAAADTDIFAGQSLVVYDMATCSDLLANPGGGLCQGKEVFHGGDAAGHPVGQGIAANFPDLQRAVTVRFINDDSVSFVARYDVTSATTYKVAKFVLTAPGQAVHNIGLLGFGDSYISGQGTYSYRQDTDTAENDCHVSQLSYPHLLGARYFNSYNSVACSGAVTKNLIGDDNNYPGQVGPKIAEAKRDPQPILANFTPGYLYQQEFATAYRPEAMLVSVGGDDIGFGDIVRSCVANEGGGTCYNTHEDRAELLTQVDKTYPKLVKTYRTLREQSGDGRLYVVGYPQIALPGGSCGLNVHLNADEVLFASQLISYLDSVVARAAATAGVSYVDTQQVFVGHRLCEAPKGQSAMNGVTYGNDSGVTIHGYTINFIAAECYHPTVLGYQLLADTIATQTNGLTKVMPTATAYEQPHYADDTPMLQNVPKTNRALNDVYYDDSLSDPVSAMGEQEHISVDGLDEQLQPNAPYQIVLHSEPIVLASGTLDGNGNAQADVAVPEGIAPGYHTVHVYTTNMAGEPVDIQVKQYVAATMDALLQDDGPCGPFAKSGVDVDDDGLDDACDPDIGAAVETRASPPPQNYVAYSAGAVNENTSLAGSQQTPVATDVTQTSVLGTALVTDRQRSPSAPKNTAATPAHLYTVNWAAVGCAAVAVIVVTTFFHYRWHNP